MTLKELLGQVNFLQIKNLYLKLYPEAKPIIEADTLKNTFNELRRLQPQAPKDISFKLTIEKHDSDEALKLLKKKNRKKSDQSLKPRKLKFVDPEGNEVSFEEFLLANGFKITDEPVKKNCRKTKKTYYYDIIGLTPGGQRWSLEFFDWSVWLSCEVDRETLKTYSSAEFITHCLHEMTFHGYTLENTRSGIAALKASLEHQMTQFDRKQQKKKMKIIK